MPNRRSAQAGGGSLCNTSGLLRSPCWLKSRYWRALAASTSVSFTGPDGVHHTLVNHNRLVTDHLYPGAPASRPVSPTRPEHTLVATATRGVARLIVVVLDTYDAYGWATRLLDVGFAKRARARHRQELPPAAGHDLCGALPAVRRDAPPGGGPARRRQPRPADARRRTTSTRHAGTTRGCAAQPDRAAATDGGEEEPVAAVSSTKTIVIVRLVLILATLYVLRVRAVRRARARRLARRRAARA